MSIENIHNVQKETQKIVNDGVINLKNVLSGKMPNVSFVKKGMGYDVVVNNPKTNTNVIYRVWNDGVVLSKKVIPGEGNSLSYMIKELTTNYGNKGKTPMECSILYRLPMFTNANGAKAVYKKPLYPQNSAWRRTRLEPMNL